MTEKIESTHLNLIDKQSKLLTQANSIVCLTLAGDVLETINPELITNTLWAVSDLLEELKKTNKHINELKSPFLKVA